MYPTWTARTSSTAPVVSRVSCQNHCGGPTQIERIHSALAFIPAQDRDTWLRIGNLLTIAESGERKSTCDGFFSASIRKYQQEQAEAMKPEIERHEAASAAWTAERDGLLAADNAPEVVTKAKALATKSVAVRRLRRRSTAS